MRDLRHFHTFVAACRKTRFPLGDFFRANKQKVNVIGWLMSSVFVASQSGCFSLR
jgi:hypothetical protein